MIANKNWTVIDAPILRCNTPLAHVLSPGRGRSIRASATRSTDTEVAFLAASRKFPAGAKLSRAMSSSVNRLPSQPASNLDAPGLSSTSQTPLRPARDSTRKSPWYSRNHRLQPCAPSIRADPLSHEIHLPNVPRPSQFSLLAPDSHIDIPTRAKPATQKD